MPRTGPSSFKKRQTSTKEEYGAKRTRLTPAVYVRSNRTELKNVYDVAVAPTSISQNGTIYSFGGVPQGTGMHERIGKAVTHQNFVLRHQFFRAVSQASCNIRIITGVWKQRYGGTPTVTDVLEVIAGSSMMQAPYKTESSKTYTILGDELLNLAAKSSVGSSGATIPRRKLTF